MSSNATRVGIGLLAVAAAVVLLVVLKDDDGSTTSAPSGQAGGGDVPTVVIKGGKPVGGVRALTYKKGETVRFEVESDVADEIHVHGYDIEEEVDKGGSVRFDFPASIEGIFEVELHHGEEQIAELTVNP